MSSSSGLDRYQIAGLDDRERGFSRPVELHAEEQGYRAVLRYEQLVITSEARATQETALLAVIAALQDRGFRQLKTQRSFRNGNYLGSQASWTEYPDQASSPVAEGWLTRVAGWFRSHAL